MLAGEASLGSPVPDSVPAVLDRPHGEVLPFFDQILRGLILNSRTDLAVVKALKDRGKELVRPSGPEPKKAAATVIYYAAIASALAFHQHKITQHSCKKLQEAYRDLGQKPWIPPELRDLFKKAEAICRQRKEKAE